ncbi:DUF4244 domain-containing protein [Thiomicrospira sp. S5]|uniref:DUF4244 domain-containing protein n=1 Tax=Thiomicrospira sp. S5 TaxID=1803865 RepID=UPI000F8A03EC|nr:DUF4244 domain-containing protein [Thiomicrospira sp. S5]AZR81107.1 hypothetical protein AYJ59_01605 [Thiomicrospira sp. S5]
MLVKTNTSKSTIEQSLNKKLKKQKGATMIEYAVVVAAVAGIAALVFQADTSTGMGKAVNDIVTEAATQAKNSMGGGD